MTEPLEPGSDPTHRHSIPPVQPGVLWAAPSPSPAGSTMKFCSACGTQIDARAEICPNCGVRQLTYGQGSGKSRVVAALLALLLGSLGIHKFYLGKTVLGVIYLIFFWTGIPGLIAWVEAIVYLATSDESWAQKQGGPIEKSNGAAVGCLWIVALLPLLAIVALVGLIFLGSQTGSSASMGLGTGGSGCDLAVNTSRFGSGDSIRMTAQFAPDLPAGTDVTVHLSRNGVEADGYPQTLKLDVATTCISGSVSRAPLPAGHYLIAIARSGGVTPPLSGEFDITP